jgi:hypothetical protein
VGNDAEVADEFLVNVGHKMKNRSEIEAAVE